ncbi:MAG: hypothetical protein J7647_31075 [Cyanobacteria bacterium SBLK]|nr:hypothetical protein [Cyanobacteria bacterium SBLK]
MINEQLPIINERGSALILTLQKSDRTRNTIALSLGFVRFELDRSPDNQQPTNNE